MYIPGYLASTRLLCGVQRCTVKTLQIRQHLIWILFKWTYSHLSATFCQFTLHVSNDCSLHASYRCKYAFELHMFSKKHLKRTHLLFYFIHLEINSLMYTGFWTHRPKQTTLRERLHTHKVFTKGQCFNLKYCKFSIKSYVLDVY